MKKILYLAAILATCILLTVFVLVPMGWCDTIGFTTYNDARQSTVSSARARAVEITMPADGQITSITARMVADSTMNGKAVIWNCGSSDHTPTTVLAVSNPSSIPTSAGWVTFTFASSVSVTNGTHYAIGVISADYWAYVCSDGEIQGYREADSSNDYTSPQTWEGGALGYGYDPYSIYATYTPSGGGAVDDSQVIMITQAQIDDALRRICI